ncbi:MAG TPA: DUF6443 domain-containing protein, partial [Flavisolibacter sp.]|nr:DUF6443 domain-containing protein [Flavisolibacter sp.]
MSTTAAYQKVFPFALLLCSFLANAQTPRPLPAPYGPEAKVNYVRTWEAVTPIIDASSLHTATSVDKARMTTQYIDGLGRPIQLTVKQGSLATGGSATDLVSPVEYDAFGREAFKYLPFASAESNGLLKLNPFQQQQSFMQAQYGGQGETFFYSQTQFESSPLSRVEKAMAPGNSWSGSNKGVEQKYWINTAPDVVRIWNVTDASNAFGSYTSSGNYLAGELYKNVAIDEHQKQVIEFKDKEGKLILKKVQLTAAPDNGSGSNHAGWLCTYYIYDDLNQLRAVIQPRGVELLETNGWNMNALNGDI